MTREVTLDDVRRALAEPRPGELAHQRMAVRPQFNAQDFSQEPPQHAGVLLLLYPQERGLYFVLTRRTERVLNHKGQISFPGGRKEAGDLSLAHTALREAEEELGIALQEVELLGELTVHHIIPSNYDIHPFVAYLPHRPGFYPSEIEVAEILEVPLDELLDPALLVEECWVLRGREVIVPFFSLNGQKVWGATGTVLNEFKVMLDSVLP
jgi:8-oxo-dGTP pyrophosphatase MutT (NUDIX family)